MLPLSFIPLSFLVSKINHAFQSFSIVHPHRGKADMNCRRSRQMAAG